MAMRADGRVTSAGRARHGAPKAIEPLRKTGDSIGTAVGAIPNTSLTWPYNVTSVFLLLFKILKVFEKMSKKPSKFSKILEISLKTSKISPKPTKFLNLSLKNFEGF